MRFDPGLFVGEVADVVQEDIADIIEAVVD